MFFELLLCWQSGRPVEPQPVKGSSCISKNETMFWSNEVLFLNRSTRLKRTSGAKFCSFCRRRSTSSKIARCSAVWPSLPSAAITSASVFQSFVFISLLKSWSILVGLVPSNNTRTLSFFFTNERLLSLLGPLELAGEKIIHHQRGDERRHAKILLRIVVEHVELELVATVDQSREEFVPPEFFLIPPLANRIQQSPPRPAQIRARIDPSRAGRRREKLAKIGIVEIRIRIFIEFPFARVIGLELDVQAIVIVDSILRRVRWRFAGQRLHQFMDVFEFLQRH